MFVPRFHLIYQNIHKLYNVSKRPFSTLLKTKKREIIVFSSLLTGGLTLGASFIYKTKPKTTDLIKDKEFEAGKFIEGLKEFDASEVAKHNSSQNGIWVTYKNGVYDITDFVALHPGGDKILLAAGGDIGPFWNLYAVHNESRIYNLLESYRIGNYRKSQTDEKNALDPYLYDPKRPEYFKVRSIKPFNAEPPIDILADEFLTPNELFFIRNHLPVPKVELKEFTLTISGLGLDKEYSFTLDELKKLPKHTITCTIQCAGNRRSEMDKVKQVKGLYWGAAAISNAEWSGARLVDVLKLCNLNFAEEKIKHVQFEGLDTDVSGTSYGASCESDLALDEKSNFLIAYEMNGKPIPPDHGFPLRLIAPGIVGARNVKWLCRIVLSEEESNSHWQRKDYKAFSPNIDWNNVDFDSVPSIQETPIQSAICYPSNGSKIKSVDGYVTIKGYAWSGGGKKVVRVDVSIDNGVTWITADLIQEPTPLNRTYSWTLWQLKLSVGDKKGKEFNVICKAVDSSNNCQPETVLPIWNLRGVLTNSWHRISFIVD